MTVRWGFLGAGSFATALLAPVVHAADGATLWAAASRDPARARALRPAGPVYSSYDDLLADPDVDAVYIALHNSAHVLWTMAALEHGKHVLCEKPLALCAADVDAVAGAAERYGKVVVEALMYRWHPRTRLLDEQVTSGRIGAVRHVAAGFTFGGVEPGNYRLDPAMGGGALFDVGGYAVSAAMAAFGPASVQDVSAQTMRATSGVDLRADLVVQYDGGEAEIHVGIDEPERQWLIVTGEHGEVELSQPAYTAWLGSDAQLLLSDGSGTERIPVPDTDAYRLMVEAVSAVVRGEDAYVVSLADSRATAAVVDAAFTSSQAGGRPTPVR